MRWVPRSAQQRIVLRRIARRLRAQDPELARLLSGRAPGVVRPLRLTTVPFAGYLVIGSVLLFVGIFLGVGSAILWGLVLIGLATLRRSVTDRTRETPVPGTRHTGHDPDRRRH